MTGDDYFPDYEWGRVNVDLFYHPLARTKKDLPIPKHDGMACYFGDHGKEIFLVTQDGEWRHCRRHEPKTVDPPSPEALLDRIEKLEAAVSRLEKRLHDKLSI